MSDLEYRVKELETKVKILEETLETLKNMQLSEEMEEYIQSKTKSLKLVNLMNAVSDEPALDFSKEEKSVRKVQAAKNSIDKQIVAALRNTTVFSEQYPDDPRYFNYEVESGIVKIGKNATKAKDEALSKYIGKGLRITSYNGFDSERVIVPAQIDGQPVISIGENAFQNASFSEIILPNSLKVILKSAFEGCTNLQYIDLPQIEYLGEKCFSNTNLKSICIPDSIEIIPHSCFSFCDNLENIILGNRIRVLKGWAFTGCLKLKNISLPETVQIIEDCFRSTALKTLIIPSGVCEISNEAFSSNGHGVTCVFLGSETKICMGHNFSGVNQIYCLPGSNVQKFAREHSIAMKPLSEFNLDKIY